jgi:hypothetical protein
MQQLGFSEFEVVMKGQIKLYVQRQLSNTLIAGAESRFEVCCVKAVLTENCFHPRNTVGQGKFILELWH